jgi:hypothetical protein
MLRWSWIAPVALLLTGCTRSNPSESRLEAATAEILIPAGTPLRVRLDEPLNTRRNRVGDAFYSTLESPILLDGHTLVPAGTRFAGRVTAAEPPERAEGRAVLAVELDSFALGGNIYRVRTSVIERGTLAHESHKIGFIATGTPAPNGPPPDLPAESTVTFALLEPLRMQHPD